MNSTSNKLTVLFLLSGIVLAACRGAATPISEGEAPPVVADNFAVIAEGRLLPRQSVQLSFETGGQVADLLVAEGDHVKADQVIARLADEEQTGAEIARAELELLQAKQALDSLNDSANMARTQAELDVANAVQAVFDAERRLNGVKYPKIKDYEDALADAQDALVIAQSNGTINEIGPTGVTVQGAQDAVEFAQDRLGEAQSAESGCGGCNPDRLAQAQDNLNGALNGLTTSQLQLQDAQLSNGQAVRDAQDAADEAQRHLTAALAGPNARQLAIAQAELEVAQTTLADAQKHMDKVKNGPDPDQLAAAKARIKSAESALAAAKAARDQLELRAPFDGTVAHLTLKVGEQVSPGQAVVTLADFSAWVVETDNLTEIDVVKIKPGQGANVVLDALPDKTLRGEVTSVGTVFEEKRGDITYTVKVTLADGDSLARWGMTAVVTFDK